MLTVMPLKFFQRAILRFETRDGLIVAAQLSCGHRATYTRPRPVGSKRSAMPCRQCGAGTRVPWENAKHSARIDLAVDRAVASPELRRALLRVLDLAVQMVATPAVTHAQSRLWAEAETALRDAGLRGGDLSGVRRDDLTGTLTRDQRRAIATIGTGCN